MNAEGIYWLIENMLKIWQTVLSDIERWLTASPFDFSPGAWSAAAGINGALLGTAYGLLLLFFLLTFFRTVTDIRELTLQQIIGWIAAFLLAKFALDSSMLILRSIVGLTLDASGIILDSFGADVDWGSAGHLAESAAAAGAEWNASALSAILQFFQSIPEFLLVCLMWVVLLIAGIIITVVVYMRFFKVFIYTALAPIPLSFFAHPELKQTAIHFLKSYGAVCLEICVIAVALVIFARTAGDNGMIFASWDTMLEAGDGGETAAAARFWTESMNYLLSLLIKAVLLTAAVLGSNRMIREIMGV